jgi:hypothetical protein
MLTFHDRLTRGCENVLPSFTETPCKGCDEPLGGTECVKLTSGGFMKCVGGGGRGVTKVNLHLQTLCNQCLAQGTWTDESRHVAWDYGPTANCCQLKQQT